MEKPKKKKLNFASIHKLGAAVSLIAFLVVILGGVMNEVRAITIAYRALGIILLIGILSRLLVRILATYEEMNSGKT